MILDAKSIEKLFDQFRDQYKPKMFEMLTWNAAEEELAALVIIGRGIGVERTAIAARYEQTDYASTLTWLEAESFHRLAVSDAQKQEAAERRQKERTTSMGMFNGIEDAEPSEGGVYVLPGIYDVEVSKCKSGMARKGFPFFVAELLVVKSSNPDRPPGCTMSWVAKLIRETPAMGDVRSLIANAEGMPLNDVTEEICEYAVGDANPLAGKRLRVVATEIITREKKPFTKLKFEPCSNKDASPKAAAGAPF